jgi:hypothetical protein
MKYKYYLRDTKSPRKLKEKKTFYEIWVVACILDLYVHRKYTLTLQWDENFFSLNRLNGVSKKSVLLYWFQKRTFDHIKKCIQKKLPKIRFFFCKLANFSTGRTGKKNFGCNCHWDQVYIFDISMKRQIVW